MVQSNERVFASILLCRSLVENEDGSHTLHDVLPDPVPAPRGATGGDVTQAVFCTVFFSDPTPIEHRFELVIRADGIPGEIRQPMPASPPIEHGKTLVLRGLVTLKLRTKPISVSFFVDGVERAIVTARISPAT